jgi:redox-sensitive bicupin YhaK (pirin superfamily)
MATNNGTANVFPIFTANGPGRIHHLANYTIERFIYFDLDLQDGEKVVLDLRPGKKTFLSTFRGNIINTILSGSDVEDFRLIPGENSISIFIDDATATANLIWDERHWSFDGVMA